MPNWKAMVCKVGKGRDAPNVNPYLPPPIGRFEWSLNPFKMIVNIMNFFTLFRINAWDLSTEGKFTAYVAVV